MDDIAEAQALARLLATHAVVLLGAAIGLIVAGAVTILTLAVRVAHRYRALGAYLPPPYLLVYLGVGLAGTAGAAAFVVIAEEALAGGELAAFDLAFAAALREQTSAWWRQLFLWVTRLGNTDVVAALVAVVAFGLATAGRRWTALAWVASQAGGGVLNLVLKATFARARPELADPLLTGSTWSFPSGHAMGTFIACGVGVYLLIRALRSMPVRVLVICAAAIWCLLMGFSRLYLGVHFASDVLAAFVVGTAWVAVSIVGFELALRRRASAPPSGMRAAPGSSSPATDAAVRGRS
jgi:undecaprenyl-diphosphatase